MEVPFSTFVGQRLAELSADLCGEVDSNKVVLLGDHGIQRGKLLPKPKARMDAYCINGSIFNFTASSLDVPLKARELGKPESVLIPLRMVQRFEQHAWVLTMVGSFLGCSGAT